MCVIQWRRRGGRHCVTRKCLHIHPTGSKDSRGPTLDGAAALPRLHTTQHQHTAWKTHLIVGLHIITQHCFLVLPETLSNCMQAEQAAAFSVLLTQQRLGASDSSGTGQKLGPDTGTAPEDDGEQRGLLPRRKASRRYRPTTLCGNGRWVPQKLQNPLIAKARGASVGGAKSSDALQLPARLSSAVT